MMKKCNLHIFDDSLGFFFNKTKEFIESIQPDNNVFINSISKSDSDEINNSYHNLESFLKQEHKYDLCLVIFHSFTIYNVKDLEKLKLSFPDNDIKFIWIFWSHEYYQLPEFVSDLYQGFSRRYYFRKVLSFHVNHFLMFLKGKVDSPYYKGLASFKEVFSKIDLFCAFIKDDYNIVMDGVEGSDFSFSSYLTVNDFPRIKLDFTKENKDIMIGHSGSPTANHYEIVKSITEFNLENKVILPLSYGKSVYIKALQKKVEQLKNDNINTLLDFLSKDEYYKSIENVGYFILNSESQQALGNIIFFLWTGTKVFLRKNSSTYKTLRDLSFYVYSIEDDFNVKAFVQLSFEQKNHNHRLLEELISPENVKKGWEKILNYSQV